MRRGIIFAKKVLSFRQGRSIICVRLFEGGTYCVKVIEKQLPKQNRLSVGERVRLEVSSMRVRENGDEPCSLDFDSEIYVPELRSVS